ncbi:hypothetical protein WEU38_18280 (plasmid) [Cyanobacterium aponinum AL20118]|uniref:Uncharacterized protein n=1 Tax=Cyanobacterium aponinum AL20115 TaxID=3090662 RepID=A0AAF1C382_9CHRO|nr:hypothetical protein [Cyanobacterium aponinum]WPF90517.1 hypothetical protein SAY89_18355 [Cyanobacterium aponinum AL20115]
MSEKRRKKIIRFTAHPNIDKALRQYCEDNNVLISEVLPLILIDFLWNAKTSSPEVKNYIKRMQSEDMWTSPLSPTKSDLHINHDLIQIVLRHALDPEILVLLIERMKNRKKDEK